MSGRIELILGGARSGKSDWAASRAAELGGDVLFVATAEGLDDDMRARIEAHRCARPPAWTTLEEPREVAARLGDLQQRHEVIVLDCLTLLVSNWLLAEEPSVESHRDRLRHITSRVDELCAALRRSADRAIVVSNEVGSGIVPDNEMARRFRDHLGLVNRLLAEQADTVLVMVAGLPLMLKSPRASGPEEESTDGEARP